MKKTKITFIIEISSPIRGRTKFRCRHLRRRLWIKNQGNPYQSGPWKLTKTLSSTESISCEFIGVPRLICLLSVRWGLTIFLSGKFSLTDSCPTVVLCSKISVLFSLSLRLRNEFWLMHNLLSVLSHRIDQFYSSLFESLWRRSRYASLSRTPCQGDSFTIFKPEFDRIRPTSAVQTASNYLTPFTQHRRDNSIDAHSLMRVFLWVIGYEYGGWGPWIGIPVPKALDGKGRLSFIKPSVPN